MNSDDRAGCSSSRSDHGDDHHRVGPNRAIDAGVPSISPFIRHRQSYSLFRNTPSPHMTSPHPPRSPRERTTTTSPPSTLPHTPASLASPSAPKAASAARTPLPRVEYIWTLISAEGNLPPPSCCHSLVAFQDRYLILFGGGSELGLSNAVYVFDIDHNTWTLIETSGDVVVAPRLGHSAVIYKDTMIVYGGQNVEEQVLYDDVLQLDLHTWRWTLLDNAPAEPHGPGPRRLHTAHVVQDRMYVFMGHPCTTQGMFWYFDLKTYTWHSLVPASPLSSRPHVSHSGVREQAHEAEQGEKQQQQQQQQQHTGTTTVRRSQSLHEEGSLSSRDDQANQSRPIRNSRSRSRSRSRVSGETNQHRRAAGVTNAHPVTPSHEESVLFGCPPIPLCGHGSVVDGDYLYLFGGYRSLETRRASPSTTPTSAVASARTTVAASAMNANRNMHNIVGTGATSAAASAAFSALIPPTTTPSRSVREAERAPAQVDATSRQPSVQSSPLLDVFLAHRRNNRSAAAATGESAATTAPHSDANGNNNHNNNNSSSNAHVAAAVPSLRPSRIEASQLPSPPQPASSPQPPSFPAFGLGVYSNALYRYHFPTNTWCLMRTTPTRDDAAASSLHSPSSSSQRTQRYGLSHAYSLPQASGPMPRYSSAMGIYDGRMYLFGGDANHAMAFMYYGDFWSLDTRAERPRWVEHTAERANRLLGPSDVPLHFHYSCDTTIDANEDHNSTANDGVTTAAHGNSRAQVYRNSTTNNYNSYVASTNYARAGAREEATMVGERSRSSSEEVPLPSSGVHRAVRVYDHWEKYDVPRGRPGPRSGTSCAVARAALYVMGGEEVEEDNFMTYTNSLHRYPLGLSYNITLRENICHYLAQNASQLRSIRRMPTTFPYHVRDWLDRYFGVNSA